MHEARFDLHERRPSRLVATAAEDRPDLTQRRNAKGEYLGSVEAPDREKAEAVAIKQFALDDDQRSRLLIRERL